ncbi:MAG: T9SS type A sorting domain-containing protein [Ekhidna sp.]
MKTRSTTNLLKHTLAMFVLMLSFATHAQQDYYWVGGTGDWSDFANHWATTSGGSEFHTSVPGREDDAYFDENSFSEPGQIVTFDLEGFQYAPGMDWSQANAPEFYRDDVESIIISGSLILNPEMEFRVDQVWIRPDQSRETIIVNPNGLSLTNTFLKIEAFSGIIFLADALSVETLEIQANGVSDASFVTNGYSINTSVFRAGRTLNATLDFTNSTVYAQDVALNYDPRDGQVISTNSTLVIDRPGGTTQIDKSETKYSFFEKYIIAEDHTIEAYPPIFNVLEVKPGVELLIDDEIAGVEFEDLVAEGKPDAPIYLRSDNQGVQATLIKDGQEISISQVTLQDIEATGTATFNAIASVDNGNVTGFNFLKGEQEITFKIEQRDYDDLGEVYIPTASATSGLDVTFTSDNEEVATSNGKALVIVGMGSSEITANQSGSELFNPANPVVRVLEVTKADQQITFPEIPDTRIGEGFVNPKATTTSGLAIFYEVIGPAQLNGNTIVFTEIGNVQVIARQDGNEHYLAAEVVQRSFEILPTPLSATTSEKLGIVYPNPAMSHLHFDPSLKVHFLKISDLSGKTYHDGILTEQTLDISTWEHGTYILIIKTVRGEEITQRIIKY